MDQVRSLMVLSENWTLRPELSISDVVDLAVAAEKAGVDGIAGLNERLARLS
jgi:dihydroorotate dehydrogenase